MFFGDVFEGNTALPLLCTYTISPLSFSFTDIHKTYPFVPLPSLEDKALYLVTVFTALTVPDKITIRFRSLKRTHVNSSRALCCDLYPVERSITDIARVVLYCTPGNLFSLRRVLHVSLAMRCHDHNGEAIAEEKR